MCARIIGNNVLKQVEAILKNIKGTADFQNRKK